MKRFTNAKLLVGLLVYAIIVAVTFGFALGGRYHKPAGETGDAIAAATPLEDGYTPSDSVTSATPNGGVAETPDASTAASPLSETPGSYTSPDASTGASPAPDTGTTPPPDVITEPSPAPDPGTEPSPTPGGDEEEEEEEDDDGEALNLFLVFAPLALFGMTALGLGAITRRRKEED